MTAALGLGSGWLIAACAARAAMVKLRLRPNPNFHPPRTDGADDPDRRRHRHGGAAGASARTARNKKLRDAWLLFGERRADTDFHYSDQRWAWSSEGSGVLARIDTVFSRSPHGEGETYVQHLVARHGEDVRAAVNQGAAILVCGGLAMAAGVQVALTDILGQEKLDAMTQEGCYRRDVY